MRKFLLLPLFFVFTATASEEHDKPLLMLGEKSVVLELIHKVVLDEAIPSSVIHSNNSIGFEYEISAWTDASKFRISISPWTTKLSLTKFAYLIEIEDLSNSINGKYSHIPDVRKKLSKAASLQSSIAIPNNTDDYKPLSLRANECFSSIATDESLAEIRSKVALGNLAETTFSMLSDIEKPTRQEKMLISLWAAKREACYKLRENYYVYFPTYVENQEDIDFVDANNQLQVNLFAGKLTYGEFANQRKLLASNFDKQKVQARKVAEKEAADLSLRTRTVEVMESEVARRRRADSLMMLNQLNSRNINCSTYSIGNTSQTNCY